MNECHYAVCLRCRASEREMPARLLAKRLVRSRTGEYVVRAVRPGGCRVCGATEVEILWGVPGSQVLPWPTRQAPGRLARSGPSFGQSRTGS